MGCINPNHLYWGSQKQNAQDSIAHGTMVRGERSPKSKLTEYDVRKIRVLSNGLNQRQLAKMFGVRYQSIQGILNGTNWAHVT